MKASRQGTPAALLTSWSLPQLLPSAMCRALSSVLRWQLGQRKLWEAAQNLKGISPLLLTHRASAGGFYTISLACSITAKHGRALKKNPKALSHNTASLSPRIAKPQNAKAADRIPRTALQSDSRALQPTRGTSTLHLCSAGAGHGDPFSPLPRVWVDVRLV